MNPAKKRSNVIEEIKELIKSVDKLDSEKLDLEGELKRLRRQKDSKKEEIEKLEKSIASLSDAADSISNSIEKKLEKLPSKGERYRKFIDSIGMSREVSNVYIRRFLGTDILELKKQKDFQNLLETVAKKVDNIDFIRELLLQIRRNQMDDTFKVNVIELYESGSNGKTPLMEFLANTQNSGNVVATFMFEYFAQLQFEARRKNDDISIEQINNMASERMSKFLTTSVDNGGNTIFMQACNKFSLDVFRVVTNFDVNVENVKSNNPTMSDEDISKSIGLIRNSVFSREKISKYINIPNNQGRTLLMEIVSGTDKIEERKQVFNLLENLDGNLCAIDREGNTLVAHMSKEFAASLKYTEIKALAAVISNADQKTSDELMNIMLEKKVSMISKDNDNLELKKYKELVSINHDIIICNAHIVASNNGMGGYDKEVESKTLADLENKKNILINEIIKLELPKGKEIQNPQISPEASKVQSSVAPCKTVVSDKARELVNGNDKLISKPAQQKDKKNEIRRIMNGIS